MWLHALMPLYPVLMLSYSALVPCLHNLGGGDTCNVTYSNQSCILVLCVLQLLCPHTHVPSCPCALKSLHPCILCPCTLVPSCSSPCIPVSSHHCTLMPLYLTPLHSHALAPLWPYILALTHLYPCLYALMPLCSHPCALMPLHSCVLIPLQPCALTPLYLQVFVPFCPCTLMPYRPASHLVKLSQLDILNFIPGK